MSLRRGILVASVVLSLVPVAAYAHAAYKDSDPKDEATVSSPPSSVWAEYTEPVEEGYLHIFDPCGVQVDNGNTEVAAYRMTVGMSSDRAGTYTVEWKAASAIDPHVTSGAFTFSVTDGEACPGTQEEDEQVDESDDTTKDGSSASEKSSGETQPKSTEARSESRSKDDRTALKGTRQGRGRSNNAMDEDAAEIELAQSAPTDTQRGIWDGIPLGGFLMAMAIAAAVGAAGGRIYANIMGPRR